MKKPLLVLILILSTLIGCGDKEEFVADVKLPLVKVKTITTENFTESYNISGVVKPIEEATISAVEGGLITHLAVDKGSRVGRGQVLIRLRKDTEYATYQQALAQFELAKSNYERGERLFNDGVTTEQNFTNAKLNLEIAEKTVEVTRQRLQNAVVRSPINGIVDQKYMNRGETSGPGSPILKIVNVSKVKITTGIPERYLPEISIGTPVNITFDVLPGEEYNGKINYISPTISTVNRTFEIEVILDNQNGKLKPEMSANLSVQRFSVDNAVVLPQSLIIDLGTEKYVFVYVNGIAKRRTVTLGGYNGNNVLVTSGLNPGDTMIVEGFQSLADDDKVKILE